MKLHNCIICVNCKVWIFFLWIIQKYLLEGSTVQPFQLQLHLLHANKYLGTPASLQFSDLHFNILFSEKCNFNQVLERGERERRERERERERETSRREIERRGEKRERNRQQRERERDREWREIEREKREREDRWETEKRERERGEREREERERGREMLCMYELPP